MSHTLSTGSDMDQLLRVGKGTPASLAVPLPYVVADQSTTSPYAVAPRPDGGHQIHSAPATTLHQGQGRHPGHRRVPAPVQHEPLRCPRCNSSNTKFVYYNNYSLNQPRYFCKTCRRYWTKGGALRPVPVGGSRRPPVQLTDQEDNQATLQKPLAADLSEESAKHPSSATTVATGLQLHMSTPPLPQPLRAVASEETTKSSSSRSTLAASLRLQRSPAVDAEAKAPLRCPRCNSTNTKFSYYNNYNITQPRHYCRTCRRFWTKGGDLKKVPVGGLTRKKRPPPTTAEKRAVTGCKAVSAAVRAVGLSVGAGETVHCEPPGQEAPVKFMDLLTSGGSMLMFLANDDWGNMPAAQLRPGPSDGHAATMSQSLQQVSSRSGSGAPPLVEHDAPLHVGTLDQHNGVASAGIAMPPGSSLRSAASYRSDRRVGAVVIMAADVCREVASAGGMPMQYSPRFDSVMSATSSVTVAIPHYGASGLELPLLSPLDETAVTAEMAMGWQGPQTARVNFPFK